MDYKQFYKYDKNGDYLETVLVFRKKNGEIKQPKNTTEIEPVLIENGISRAMYYPNWNGAKWTEDKEKWIADNPTPIEQLTDLEELQQDDAEQLLYVAEVEQQARKARQNNADLLLSLAEAGVL
ncbi:hypothetical protein [Listeria seeligeri]|uniref:hypothetical protein n=1 Tax=Listeria seeligeri TaxID=1640 RepID=UPI0016240C74|nr:hypothetical protein [Listeria seeligeri]MBC1934565.1 hypothetical protein [Listeria seeligeri]